MSELLKCIECGGNVSSTASSCPHCNTTYYQGFRCRVCLKKTQSGVDLKRRPSGWGDVICSDCKANIDVPDSNELMPPIPCPVCRNKIANKCTYGHLREMKEGEFYRSERKKYIVCHSCGHYWTRDFTYDQEEIYPLCSICYQTVDMKKSGCKKKNKNGRQMRTHLYCHKVHGAAMRKRKFSGEINKIGMQMVGLAAVCILNFLAIDGYEKSPNGGLIFLYINALFVYVMFPKIFDEGHDYFDSKSKVVFTAIAWLFLIPVVFSLSSKMFGGSPEAGVIAVSLFVVCFAGFQLST